MNQGVRSQVQVALEGIQMLKDQEGDRYLKNIQVLRISNACFITTNQAKDTQLIPSTNHSFPVSIKRILQ
jgi:hypothetical protein